MSALHEAISNIDLAAMRARLDAGVSPYSLDSNGRNAWDCINQNPKFHVHLGSKSRDAWTIRELLGDMAKLPPKNQEERSQGNLAHAEAHSQKVSGTVLVAGLIKKAILKLVTLDGSQLDALGFENIGRRHVEQALAGRATNLSLPHEETAQVRVLLEAAERRGTAQGMALLQFLEVSPDGVVMKIHTDGTVAPAEFMLLDNSLLQDFVDEGMDFKASAVEAARETITIELPSQALLKAAATPLVAPLSVMPKTLVTVELAKAMPMGGRPARLNTVPPAGAVPVMEAWRADRPSEDSKPAGLKPLNRPPRVG